MHAKQPTLAELIDALPAGMDQEESVVSVSEESSAQAELQRMIANMGSKPIPTGRVRRMWSIGSLQAKIVAAKWGLVSSGALLPVLLT